METAATIAPAVRGTATAGSESPAETIRPGEKIALGMGGLPIQLGSITVQSMAIPVYQMMMGVNPALLGAALAVPRLWDAFIDPLVGNLSDNYRSRWGRRKPFIALGAVAMGLAYALIWLVQPGWSSGAKVAYLIGTALLFYTCYAVFSIPYQSLTYEASPDYRERTRVMAHYSLWYRVGDLVYGWIFPFSQKLFALGLVASPMLGVHVATFLVGVIGFIGFGLVPALLGKERYYKRVALQEKVRFWPAIHDAVRNRALLIVIVLALLKIVPSMLASSMDQYLLVYYIFDGDITVGQFWKAALSTCYGVVGLLSIPLLSSLANRHGKRAAMVSVYALVVVAGTNKWLLFVPGHRYIILLDAVCSAPIWVGLSMLLPSMIADACDEEELATGRRAEGMFGAVYNWILKAGVSLAFLGTGLLLNLVGFDSHRGSHQAPETFFWMRFSFAGVTTVSAIFGVIAALFYPITQDRADTTRRLLEQRRGTI